MNGEETRFKKGDKAAEKWTEDECENVFPEIVKRSHDNNWYSIQECVLECKDIMPYSTFFYLLNKFPNLDIYKKELDAIIISRVNKGAITNDLNPTACIWRMKQLGERDRIDTIAINKNVTVELDDKEREEALKEIKDGLNELNDY